MLITKIELTDAGSHYYKIATGLLQQIDEQKRDVQQFALAEKTHLVITISPALVSTNILTILHNFMRTNTNYHIDITLADKQVNELLQHDVHIAISHEKATMKQFHAEALMTAPLMLAYTGEQVGDTIDEQIRYLLQRYPLYVGYLHEHHYAVPQLEREYPFMQTQTMHNSLFA